MDNLIETVEIICSVNQHTICQFYNKQDIVVWEKKPKMRQVNKIYIQNSNKTECTVMMHSHT